MNKQDNSSKDLASKRVSTRSRIRSENRDRDAAKQCTARHQRIPVALSPSPEYSKNKLTKKLYMKNKFLLQRKNNPSKRKIPFNAKKLTNSMELAALKRNKRSKEKLNKSERDDLKHLLADLLDKKPKLNKSDNFEYVKASPIFKLISHNAERRNCLRGKHFQKQLEIPNFFQHPLGETVINERYI